MCGPPGGGTIDMVSPQGGVDCFVQHFLVDVLPAIYCCTGLFPDCASYYAKRPSTKSVGYASECLWSVAKQVYVTVQLCW